MDKDHFKNQAQEILSSFTQDPPDHVWESVNARLSAKKKKRRFIFWLLPLSIIAGVIAVNLNKSAIDSNHKNNSKQQPSLLETYPSGNMDSAVSVSDPKIPTTQSTTAPDNSTTIQLPENTFTSGKIADRFTLKEEEASTNFIQPEPLNAAFPAEVPDQNQDTNSKQFLPVALVDLTAIPSPKPLNLPPSFKIDTLIVVACVPTQTHPIPKKTWHYQAAYAFHGTGDLEGMQLEWGFSKPINRYFSFYNNVGVSLHGGSVVQPLNLNILVGPSAAPPIGQASIYEITSAIQTAPTLLGSIPGTPLRVGVGGLLRYQFYSGGSGYGVQRSQTMQTFTLRDGNYNGVSLGYRVVVGLELLKTKKHKLQFQAGFQNDTRGDVITGLGLSWQYTKQ